MVTKTETIKTSSGTFECEVLNIDTLAETPKDLVGKRVTDKDYDRIIDNNVVIYHKGKRAIVFLKKAMTTLLNIDPGSRSYSYWRWVSRDLFSSQRGVVGGKEFTTDVNRRFTNGQVQFFRLCKKGKFEEAVAALKDKSFSANFFYINKLEKSPYFDMRVLDELAAKLRKKDLPYQERQELSQRFDEERLSWFDKWFKDWEESEDKQKFANETYESFASSQTYMNNIYSNVLGVLDRGARNPYGRWTASTQKKFDDFVSQQCIYEQASLLYRETMEDEWNYIHSVMKECKDPEYTLLGTKTFSTITLNWNFPTYWHFDGKNNDRGVAVLTALTNESHDGEKFEGSLFVMGAFRLAFNIRKGDFFIGDNQGFMHGQTLQENKCEDVDNIVFVFYARAGMTKLESFKNECCRKSFVQYSKEHLAGKYRKHDGGRFMGIFPGQWHSPEWIDYKAKHCPDATNTNWWYTEE